MTIGVEEDKNLIELVNKTKGNIAEVGVANGDSAEVIAKAKSPYRHLYLFDTFTGLPKPTKIDGEFHEGQYSSPYEAVKERLKEYKNVHIIKGLFPNTAIDKKFSLVHLDVDLYQSTRDCLEDFWPKLKKSGWWILLLWSTPMNLISKSDSRSISCSSLSSL